MLYNIHQANNIFDLNEIVKEHYHLSEEDLLKIKNDELSDPLLCTNMKICVDILKDIKKNNEKILICGDYDCDGICATAILCRAFEAVGIQYGFYIPDRMEEGYGLSLSAISKAYDKGYRNVISVDNGVRAVEAMKLIKEKNMRFILTDHHTFHEEDIHCDCFIHPFLKDDDFQKCCGAGMALQIARCLIPEDREIVALASLATIADCMDVTHENRRIIRKGIEYLNQGCLPALHALKNRPQDLFDMKMMAYTIIPKINSLGRMSDHVNANNAVRYLLLKDQNAIMNAAAQINQINELRKTKTMEMEKIANGEIKNKPFEVIAHSEFHEGIVGLVASRLAGSIHRPVAVLCEMENEFKGSMRSVEGFDLIDYFKDFSSFKTFGGHAQAAGISLKKENMKDFLDYLESHEMIYQDEEKETLCEWVDESALSIQSVMDYMKLAPFGNGFEEILFYFHNLQIKNITSLSNGKYYKAVSSSGLEFLLFKSSLGHKIKDHMNLIGKCTLNEYRGKTSVNIIIEDILEENIYEE